jgi:hypothetical protein
MREMMMIKTNIYISKGPRICSFLHASEIFKLWVKMIMRYLKLFYTKGKGKGT